MTILWVLHGITWYNISTSRHPWRPSLLAPGRPGHPAQSAPSGSSSVISRTKMEIQWENIMGKYHGYIMGISINHY
jgi:hypothetical protein